MGLPPREMVVLVGAAAAAAAGGGGVYCLFKLRYDDGTGLLPAACCLLLYTAVLEYAAGKLSNESRYPPRLWCPILGHVVSMQLSVAQFTW